MVERPAPHISQRCDLDDPTFKIPGEAVESHDIVKRVVQRPYVRIDLALQVARQEAQLFACFYRRARQDDSGYFVLFKALTAIATAKYVFPVPAGPIPNTS